MSEDTAYLERLGKYEDQVEELGAQLATQSKRLHELEEINSALWDQLEQVEDLSGYTRYSEAAKQIGHVLSLTAYLSYSAVCRERYERRECVGEINSKPVFKVEEGPILTGENHDS